MKQLPLISYIVKTQILTNKAGLRYLSGKIFNDENILEARRKAYEYYEAAIDVLQREGEILKDENGKIVYKNPQDYQDGIKMFVRINRDFFRRGIIADKKDTQYQIEAHYTLNSEQKRKLKFGQKMYQRYLKVLKVSIPEPMTQEMLNYYKGRLGKGMELNRLRTLGEEDLACIKFKDKNYSQHLLESACAFLNTKGGTIILGQDHSISQKNSFRNLNKDLQFAEQILKSNFPEHVPNFKCSIEHLQGINFIKVQVSKSEKDAFYQDEYFIRTRYGNVIDWDMTFG